MSLVGTRMQNFRAASNAAYKWENRASRYGGLEIFASQTSAPMSIISDELQAAAGAANGNTLQSPVFNYKDVTINSTRPITVSDDENTSAMQNYTFVTYQFGFTMIPGQYTNNKFGYQQDFNVKLQAGINKLMATMDTACLTALNTNKTQVLADDLGYTFASNVLNATNAQRLRVIANLVPFMHSNDFYDDLHIVGNMGLMALMLEMSEQGLANEQNRRLQWLDKTLSFSNRLSNAASKEATGYVINGASLGLLHRVDRDARLNHSTGNGYQFSVQRLPGVPVPMGLMYYDNVQDKSALHAGTSDQTATKVEGYSFSVDVAYVTSYNSDAATIASPILKFDIADS